MAAFAFLRYLQNRSRVSVWLYENVNTRIEGHIIGFDEYMNLVMDGAEEVRRLLTNGMNLAGREIVQSSLLRNR